MEIKTKILHRSDINEPYSYFMGYTDVKEMHFANVNFKEYDLVIFIDDSRKCKVLKNTYGEVGTIVKFYH